KRLGLSNPVIRVMKSLAKGEPKRVVFAEAENYKMLKAAEIVLNEDIAVPVLLGNRETIEEIIKSNDLELSGVEILDPKSKEQKQTRQKFSELYWNKRQRKGVTLTSAQDAMLHRNYFSPMLVETGYADAMISGLTRNYPDTIRPAIEIIGKKPGAKLVSGMYIIITKDGPYFLADCTVNKNPTVEEMVEITLQTAFAVEQFKIKPRIAFVSYSNFGSNDGAIPQKQREAVAMLHRGYPELVVDGEMQVNVALSEEILQETFPFSKLVGGRANTLIFPYLTAGNIAYKLLQSMGKFEVIGPVINGLNKSVHVLQIGASVTEIVNMVTIAVMDAQCAERRRNQKECY
ncbi:MAG: NADP-dependent malic enzyme, partial [Bacteroidetes bacterium]|nr:NADP-dependent malic enzyme [Bacteroidota bacterium]